MGAIICPPGGQGTKCRPCVIRFRDLQHINMGDAAMASVKKCPEFAAFEAIPDAVILVDRDGSIVFANRHADRVFGYERGKLVGFTIKSLIPERDRKEHAWLVDGLFARPTARPMGTSRKLHGLRSDGKEFPAEIANASGRHSRNPRKNTCFS